MNHNSKVVGRDEKKYSGDQFSEFDLNYFLFCFYEKTNKQVNKNVFPTCETGEKKWQLVSLLL